MWSSSRAVLLASVATALACGHTRDAPSGTTSGGNGAGMAGESPLGSGGSNPMHASAGAGTTGAGTTGAAGATGAVSGVGGTPATQGGAPSEPNTGGQGDEGGSPAAAAPLDIEAILKSYRTFSPLTPEPVDVSGYIFGLCRLPTLPENEFLASVHGDGRFLQDWANAAAQAGLQARGTPAFPVGAAIVKEKYAGAAASEADLVALGIMIKRDPGFDSAHGDWEYAYYEPALGVIRTTEQSSYCAACHAGASASDYVFVDGFQPPH
jgi:hypothetical protein